MSLQHNQPKFLDFTVSKKIVTKKTAKNPGGRFACAPLFVEERPEARGSLGELVTVRQFNLWVQRVSNKRLYAR